MLMRTILSKRLLVAFGGTAALSCGSSFAQDTSVQELQRVEITGSAIKRIDAETAVPVTILKVEDLRKQGVTTIEQIVSRLGSNQSSQGTSQSVGAATGGASFANLRGLGQSKTLVLLNGRRIANNAIDSSAPDLNMIPFAALDRVEVLRDGASALYGSDAIGGVINFITKKDFTGGVVTLGADSPQHHGANSRTANVGFGYGDLANQKFNVFGFIDYQMQDSLRAAQRPELLQRSVKTSTSSFPGNYNQGGAVGNPGFPTCASPDGLPLGNGTTDATCGYLYSRQVDLVPTTERSTGFVKGTLQITDAHQAGLEYFYSQNRNSTLIAGVPYSNLFVNPSTKYYPGNGITPLPGVFTLDPTYLPSGAPAEALPGVLKVRWRDTTSGGRREETDNTQQRLIASLEGSVVGWDYRTAFTYNENKLTDKLTGGYTDGTIVTPGVLNGIVNPFGGQDAAGAALLSSAAALGTLFTAKGTVYAVDAQISRELGDWLGAGRPAGIAFGGEYRKEKFKEIGNSGFDTLVVSSTGFDPATDNEGSRNVTGLYTELNVPIFKQLEVTGSLRYDKYSDVGNTTNPKVSFRYEPIKELLVRGSFSKGFRAPSLFDINDPNTYTNTDVNFNDPVRCPGSANNQPPGGAALPNVSPSDNCGVQFLRLQGGNKNLKPETSKNFTLGFVVEPATGLSAGLDFWWIRLQHEINYLDDSVIFANPAKYAALFHRAPDGSLSTDGTQCPGSNCGYVSDTTDNLGEIKTRGIDVSTTYRLKTASYGNFLFDLNGTYVTKYDYQVEENGVFISNLGVYGGGITSGGPAFRWQHSLNVNWTLGAFGAGLVNNFKTHYLDQTPTNTVASYTTWDGYGSWQPLKYLSLTAGIKNLFDRSPPYSNQGATFQVGYDPRFADAQGRTYYFRGTYTF